MIAMKPATRITIRAFRAIDDIASSETFVRNHRAALTAHGISLTSSAMPEWVDNPNVVVVVAESEDGQMLGGVRVHKSAFDSLLPVEVAASEEDPQVTSLVRKAARKGTGEVCGMWVDEEFEGKCVSDLLLRAAISIANQIGVRSLFAFCSDHTSGLIRSMGFQLIESLGNNGKFAYPSPEFASRVYRMNAVTLQNTKADNYDAIGALRKQPAVNRRERSRRETFDVCYELRIPVEATETACIATLAGIRHRTKSDVRRAG